MTAIAEPTGSPPPGPTRTATRRSRAWASSPTRRSASAARRARSRARNGTSSPRTASSGPARATTTRRRSARTRGGTSRSSSSASRCARDGETPATARRRAAALADVERRLQALHARRLPRRLPDRLALPHRVRHRRRAGGHLQRLRLLRPRLPVRRPRQAPPAALARRRAARAAAARREGGRARLEVHALLRPAQGRPRAGVREGVPDGLDPVRRARRAARARGRAARQAAGAGLERRAAVRPRSRRRRRRLRRVLPAARRARGVRPAARSGRARRSTCRRCGRRPRSQRPRRSSGRRWRSSEAAGERHRARHRDAVVLRPADRQGAGVAARDPVLLLHRRHRRRLLRPARASRA